MLNAFISVPEGKVLNQLENLNLAAAAPPARTTFRARGLNRTSLAGMVLEEERLTTSFSTSDDGEPTLLHVVASISSGDGWASYTQWAEPGNKWVAVSSGHGGSLRPTLKRVNSECECV